MTLRCLLTYLQMCSRTPISKSLHSALEHLAAQALREEVDHLRADPCRKLRGSGPEARIKPSGNEANNAGIEDMGGLNERLHKNHTAAAFILPFNVLGIPWPPQGLLPARASC